jgi:hypothetical protein
MAVVIATGVRADGGREVLGLAVGDPEDGAFWTAFLPLGVTESGCYAWRSRPTSPRALRRIFLAGEIVDDHRAPAGIYGAHCITAELRFGRQIIAGHNAVASIMRESRSSVSACAPTGLRRCCSPAPPTWRAAVFN